MMKLYVPEIGDHIRLTQDWTFSLHAEGRNEQLGAVFGHYLGGRRGSGWIDESILPRLTSPDFTQLYPSQDDPRFTTRFGRFDRDKFDNACREAENSNKEYVEYREAWPVWAEQADSLKKGSIEVTIPAGTVLAIDRIYVRKGASDFSSITFYAKELGEVTIPGSPWSWRNQKPTKRKAQRFWAKLNDCNRIEFEIIEK